MKFPFNSENPLDVLRSVQTDMQKFQLDTLHRKEVSMQRGQEDAIFESREQRGAKGPNADGRPPANVPCANAGEMVLPSHPLSFGLDQPYVDPPVKILLPACSLATSLDLVVSGITPCPPCSGSGGSYFVPSSININGSYSIPKTAPGYWLLPNAISWTDYEYWDSACATLVHTNSNIWNIDISCTMISGVPTYTVTIFGGCFSGTGLLGVAISNTSNVCTPGSFRTDFYGGTVTISEP